MKKILLVLILALTFTGFSAVSQAEAAPVNDSGGGKTCIHKVQNHVASFATDAFYQAPGHFSPVETAIPRQVRLVMTGLYWHCPTTPGKQSARDKFKWFDYCYTFVSHEEHFWFQGVWVKAYSVSTTDSTVDAPSEHIKDNDETQNCVHADIPTQDEKWQRSAGNTKIQGPWRIVLKNPLFDEKGHFRWWSHKKKMWIYNKDVAPATDMVVSKWHDD